MHEATLWRLLRALASGSRVILSVLLLKRELGVATNLSRQPSAWEHIVAAWRAVR